MNSGNLENLLAGLREETRDAEAPRHVEAALLSAFRGQAGLPVRRGWGRWALAAAAALAVVFIGAAAWKSEQPVPQLPPAKLAVVPPAPMVVPMPVSGPLVASYSVSPSWRGHSCLPRRDSSRRSRPDPDTTVETSLDPAGTSACATTDQVKRPRRTLVTPVAKPEPPVQEIATDFMPIEDTMSLAPIESGHVLRVALPRSAMMRFGFPVNQDRMMEPVKADVVFAQDGIARAIRFVK
jgi:hypothetical protein